MNWKWISSSHPISDIRDWSNNQRLEIRPDFQRNEVWSPAARVLLMDTILRNIPMPKIFLQAVLRDADTYRIVIDGQQRIKAILSFLKDDGFRLTKPYSGEFLGLRFRDLPAPIQEEILSYKIDINEIRNAPDDVVRDIYLRVNKYTVALNKQELRRADYPGEFLWLAEELAQDAFLEEGKVFTVTNSKRMGDVEYVSELLALLIAGPQEKRETLDEFYLKYTEWDAVEKDAIRARFKSVISDMQRIWSAEGQAFKAFSDMRFRQKADFYSLFAAIDDCQRAGGAFDGKPGDYLRDDLGLLDFNTEPESDVSILSKYAIQCVSQANSVGSRRWRRDFLKLFLEGTYFARPPSINGVKTFHEILWDLYVPGICPTTVSECPVCGVEDIEDYSTSHVFLTWEKSSPVFQITNAVFVHAACANRARAEYFVWDAPYNLEYDTPYTRLSMNDKGEE